MRPGRTTRLRLPRRAGPVSPEARAPRLAARAALASEIPAAQDSASGTAAASIVYGISASRSRSRARPGRALPSAARTCGSGARDFVLRERRPVERTPRSRRGGPARRIGAVRGLRRGRQIDRLVRPPTCTNTVSTRPRAVTYERRAPGPLALAVREHDENPPLRLRGEEALPRRPPRATLSSVATVGVARRRRPLDSDRARQRRPERARRRSSGRGAGASGRSARRCPHAPSGNGVRRLERDPPARDRAASARPAPAAASIERDVSRTNEDLGVRPVPACSLRPIDDGLRRREPVSAGTATSAARSSRPGRGAGSARPRAHAAPLARAARAAETRRPGERRAARRAPPAASGTRASPRQ